MEKHEVAIKLQAPREAKDKHEVAGRGKIFLIVSARFHGHAGHIAHALEYYYSAIDKAITQPNYNYILGVHPRPRVGARFINRFLKILTKKFPSLSISEANDLREPKDGTISSEVWTQRTFPVGVECNKLKGGHTGSKIVKHKVSRWMSPAGARILRTTLCGPDEFRKKPSIGIINRRPASGRHLTNSGEIKRMTKDLGLVVEETFFEGKSFEYQIGFNNSHDIIIAPHGANLSSTPFIPDYGMVIECAHPEWIPYSFFSGLSLSSGKSHCIICKDHPFPHWSSPEYRTKDQQRLDVWVDPAKVVDAIKDFMAHRNSMHEKLQPDSVTFQLR